MVGMCAFTVNNSDCDIAFNNEFEIHHIIYSMFLHAVQQLATSESVNVSLSLPSFLDMRAILFENNDEKASKLRNCAVRARAPNFFDRATFFIELENPIQLFLRLKEATEVFFVQQCHAEMDHLLSYRLVIASFASYEHDSVMYVGLFNRFVDRLNIFCTACPVRRT